MSLIKSILSSLLIIISFSSSVTFALSTITPDLLLAKTYQNNDIAINQYWISEKYDGVRAYWDGSQLISRQGNVYHAPLWFIKDFPEVALDGELWMERNHFEALLSTVRKGHPIDSEWKKVRYMVFELPDGEGSFSHRLQQLEKLLNDRTNPFIELVKQLRLNSHEELIHKLNEVVEQGAEGLMMHRADALYNTGRSDDLLKVKPYQDAEATIIEHKPGKGKYAGMLGSILVEKEDGKRFKIGSGFSDYQRKVPPPIGTVITYKYYGLTKNGIPRFASFLRIRKN